jgi:hypothetical protein
MSKQQMGDLVWKDLSMRTAQLKKQFNEQVTVVERKIPEQIFLAYFLDWFAGEKEDTDQYLEQQWNNIAGSPFEAVLIVDKLGKTVIRVPPRMDRNVVPIKTTRELNVPFMMTKAVQVAELSAQLANTQVLSQLTNNYLTDRGTTASERLVAEWEKLLTYYGKTIKNKAAVATETQNDSNDLQISYDD